VEIHDTFWRRALRFRGDVAVSVHRDHYRTGCTQPSRSLVVSFRQRTIERALAHGLARVLGGKQRAHDEDRGSRHDVPRRGGAAMAEAFRKRQVAGIGLAHRGARSLSPTALAWAAAARVDRSLPIAVRARGRDRCRCPSASPGSDRASRATQNPVAGANCRVGIRAQVAPPADQGLPRLIVAHERRRPHGGRTPL